ASEANAGQTTYSNGTSTYRRGGYTYQVTEGVESDDGIANWINAEDLRMGGSAKIGSITELARKAIHDAAQATGEATQDYVEKALGELGVSRDTRGTISAVLATIPATVMEAAGDVATTPLSVAGNLQDVYHREGGGWRGL